MHNLKKVIQFFIFICALSQSRMYSNPAMSIKRMLMCLTGGNLVREGVNYLILSDFCKMMPDNLGPNTKKFIKETLDEAHYSREEINNFRIRYLDEQNSFGSFNENILIPINDNDLKKFQADHEKKALWQGILLHEFYHATEQHCLKRFLYTSLTSLVLLSLCREKSNATSKSIIRFGATAFFCGRLFCKWNEVQADYNVIRRAKNPVILEQLSKDLYEDPILAVFSELFTAHPNGFLRSHYFLKAAQKLRKASD